MSPPTKTKKVDVGTDLFARSHLSESFIEKSIRATVIVAVLYLDDPNPDCDRILQEFVIDRILEVPRFRSIFSLNAKNEVIITEVPKKDIDLDLSYHWKSVDGKGEFDENGIGEVMTAASIEDWDMTKPLWRILLVKNLKDGRSVLCCKINHAIGDGIFLTHALTSFLDTNKDTDKPSQAEEQSKSKGTYIHQRRLELPKLRLSHKIIAYMKGVYWGVMGWALIPTDPDNSLKVPFDTCITTSPGKMVLYTRKFPLSQVKDMKNKLPGASVNDVMMAVITIGIKRYYEKCNDKALPKILNGKTAVHASFTYNTRPNATTASHTPPRPGNDFMLGNFPLPLQYTSPIDAVWRCKNFIDELKVSPAFYLMKNISGFLVQHLIPEYGLAFTALENAKKPTCFVSNIRLPPIESKIAGHTVKDVNFMVSSNIGSYFGILSYNNSMSINVAVDKLTSADTALLKECLEAGYDELHNQIKSSSPKDLIPPNATPLSATLLEILAPVSLVAVTAAAYLYLR